MTHKNRILYTDRQKPVSNWQIVKTDEKSTPVFPIAVGQNVVFSDGYSGKITRLLGDKDGQPQRLVVRPRGWSRRQVLVPMDHIARTDGEDVYLSITKRDLKKLPTYRADDVLEAWVYHALWEDTILRRTDYRQIGVKVENGIAYLSGYVSYPFMSSGAERAASKVEGIWKVKNDLVIDSDLEMAVAQAIANDPRTRNARVYVGVKDGFVTLTGQAPGLESRTAAQEQAVAMPRVRGVINSICVPGIEIEVSDQHTWQPAIGASIHAADSTIGKVEKVVIDPDSRLVTAILADARLPNPGKAIESERKIIIPIGLVRHVSSTSVSLNEHSSVVAGFDDFDPGAYIQSPEVWEPPYPYRHTDILLSRDHLDRD
jgi:osmotically-inducible protein OsmY